MRRLTVLHIRFPLNQQEKGRRQSLSLSLSVPPLFYSPLSFTLSLCVRVKHIIMFSRTVPVSKFTLQWSLNTTDEETGRSRTASNPCCDNFFFTPSIVTPKDPFTLFAERGLGFVPGTSGRRINLRSNGGLCDWCVVRESNCFFELVRF